MVPLTALTQDHPVSPVCKSLLPLFSFQIVHLVPQDDSRALECCTSRFLIRAIEVVFVHHPNAKVVIHSATKLHLDDFDLFNQVGYNLEVQVFDWANLLQGFQSAKSFKITSWFKKTQKSSKSLKMNLICLLVLQS